MTVALLWPSAAAADEPVLHVRAKLRVDIDGIERVADGLVVRGQLRDDANDEPVAGRTVAISVEGDHGFYHYAEPAGPDGTFRWRVPLPLGSYRLHIAAGGDDEYVGAPPIDRVIDVARSTPNLIIHAPERWATAAESLHVVVEGLEERGDGSPHALQDVDGVVMIDGKRYGDAHFANGRSEIDLPGPFGRPGQQIALVVTVAADELRNAAQATHMILLTTTSRVTLEADRLQVAPDDKLVLRGLATDDGGHVANAAIGIGKEGGPDLVTVLTDDSGHFEATLRALDLGPRANGEALLEARLHPRDDWREPALSPTLAIKLLEAPPITVWPYLVSPLLTLLAAAAFLAGRERRWTRWRIRRRAVQRAAAPPPAVGLTEARPSILSTLRGRADHGLTGVVVDAVDDRPLAIAGVVARSASGEARAATVDENGFFALEGLPPGPIVVDIAAAGYVSERFRRVLPHRGELRGARIRLVPVRVRIFDAWRRAIGPLAPEKKRPNDTFMTPRELLRYVDSRAILPNEPLHALTALVESAVWAAHAPSHEDLAEAERLAKLLADS